MLCLGQGLESLEAQLATAQRRAEEAEACGSLRVLDRDNKTQREWSRAVRDNHGWISGEFGSLRERRRHVRRPLQSQWLRTRRMAARRLPSRSMVREPPPSMPQALPQNSTCQPARPAKGQQWQDTWPYVAGRLKLFENQRDLRQPDRKEKPPVPNFGNMVGKCEFVNQLRFLMILAWPHVRTHRLHLRHLGLSWERVGLESGKDARSEGSKRSC